MKIGRKAIESVDPSMDGEFQIAYCSHCSRLIETVFYKGELVLVEIPATRPHYGLIIQAKQDQEGSGVLIDIGGNEKEFVLIDYISKVG